MIAAKTLRSSPARVRGEWLKGRRAAREGDYVRIAKQTDGTFLFEHVPAAHSVPLRLPLDPEHQVA